MTLAVDAPPAARLRAPSWRDPRLLVGVLLVLASVVAGTLVVRAADDTVPVWAAARTLAPGEAIDPGDLAVVRVRLEQGTAGYLPAAQDPSSGGSVVLRGVGAGELVPAAAVGSAAALERRPVGVPVEGPLPGGTGAGSLVDVWVSAAEGGGVFAAPQRLAASAEVAELSRPEGTLGGSGATTVHVLLPDAELRDLLDALANDARVALVPVPGSSRGQG